MEKNCDKVMFFVNNVDDYKVKIRKLLMDNVCNGDFEVIVHNTLFSREFNRNYVVKIDDGKLRVELNYKKKMGSVNISVSEEGINYKIERNLEYFPFYDKVRKYIIGDGINKGYGFEFVKGDKEYCFLESTVNMYGNSDSDYLFEDIRIYGNTKCILENLRPNVGEIKVCDGYVNIIKSVLRNDKMFYLKYLFKLRSVKCVILNIKDSLDKNNCVNKEFGYIGDLSIGEMDKEKRKYEGYTYMKYLSEIFNSCYISDIVNVYNIIKEELEDILIKGNVSFKR